ncbi:hypothetical protein O181_028053 [Austropuccinia psidii MF-1]|uniref:Uncharacterized protein n=1 Tax=Austropuccinia psidii MF-1 TaxID=1389203 RepID=A0A9Q3CSZ7_9BASI|nr:hypothetical protein [Austropuccinia psidii MF-1]
MRPTILLLLQSPQAETKMLPPISAPTPASYSLPLTILTLPQHPQGMPPTPPSTPLTPPPTCHLPFLPSCIRFIGYGGLLAYMMNAITEIC